VLLQREQHYIDTLKPLYNTLKMAKSNKVEYQQHIDESVEYIYWMKASNLHKDYWREKLDSHITPAVDKMIELLASDDEKVAQKAIEQIMKYSGNEIQKIDLEARVNVIDVSFGE
jgi:hypothetical protein